VTRNVVGDLGATDQTNVPLLEVRLVATSRQPREYRHSRTTCRATLVEVPL
jgi:hypothetical protein